MYFEIYVSGSTILTQEWRWRLKSANHRIVADSGEGYVSKQGCLEGIALVMGTSSNTPVHGP
jgi:uncharacterized protein YegP (UPF0339 family)